MMKAKVFVISMLIAGAACAQMATPESLAAAEKLMDVLKMAENFDSSIRQAVQMQSGMLDQMGLSEEEKALAQKSVDSSMRITMERFSWANMKGMFAEIYAEVFTEEELVGIITFYESPAGQKFVEKQPQLMQVTMQKMQGIMAQIMPEIQKEAQKAIEQAKSVVPSVE